MQTLASYQLSFSFEPGLISCSSGVRPQYWRGGGGEDLRGIYIFHGTIKIEFRKRCCFLSMPLENMLPCTILSFKKLISTLQ